MLNKVKNTFQNLNPKHKRYLIIGGMVGAFLIVAYTMNSGGDKTKTRNQPDENIRAVLTSRDTRNLTMDSLSADLNSTKRNIDEINKQITQLNANLERTRSEAAGTSPVVQNEILRLQSTIKTLQEDLEFMRTQPKQSGQGGDDPNLFSANESVESPTNDPLNQMEQELGDLNNVFSSTSFDSMSRPGATPITAPEAGLDSEAINKTPSFVINTYQEHSEADEAAEEEKRLAEKEEKELMYLPSGSIITGVFINGLDAPTGQGARRDPFPAALRIQHEAILPNHFRADIRECFLLVSGYGDLSSERAYLRGETLSCVRNDGGVIESKLNSYAVGEDGKAGVKGRLVSKQGQLIARTLVAGFLSGTAEAFDVNPIPVLSTSSTGSTQFESRGGFNKDFWQSAGVKGASNAMEKIADYYLNMAEGIFPVIEIVSGRQVDIIITKGTQLRLRSK